MKLLNIAATALLITTFSNAATSANDSTKENKTEFTNEFKQGINIGFVNTTGNTETSNLNGKYELDMITKGFNDKKLEIEFEASAFMSKNNDIKDNEEYRFKFNKNQFITKNLFLYGNVEWMKNEFLNFDSNWDIGLGIGKEFFKNETHSLKAKIGIAHNMEDYTVATPEGLEEKNFTSLTQYIEYKRNLNKTSKLYAKLGLSENMSDITEDYDLFTTIGMNFKVAEDISVILEEEIRYDSIPASTSKTDTKTLAKIGYSF